jgi:hypothetical protein
MSKCAVTAESTPPDKPTTTLFILQNYARRFEIASRNKKKELHLTEVASGNP